MAGGTAQRADYPVGILKDTYGYFLDADLYSIEPDYIDQICEKKTTNAAQERATSVVYSNAPRERAENEDMVPDKPIEGFSTYALVKNHYLHEKMTKEVMRDHQKLKNFMKDTTKHWAEDMRRGRNEWLMDYFNKGAYLLGDPIYNASLTNGMTDASANFVYDTVHASAGDIPLFNASGNLRYSKGGGSYYNSLSNSLTPANFETLHTRMTVDNAYNEDDTKIVIHPNFLLFNNSIKWTARRIFESDMLAGSTTNDKNVLKGEGFTLLGTNYFTDVDAYILMEAKKGIRWYTSETPDIEIWYNNLNKTHYVSIEEAYGVMILNWRFFGSSNLATSA